jgi:hypothetical protein
MSQEVSVIKSELKSMLLALLLVLVGGIMLVGAAALFFMPILAGEEPNIILVCVLGIPGAIIEVIGDFKFINLKSQAMKRKVENLKK